MTEITFHRKSFLARLPDRKSSSRIFRNSLFILHSSLFILLLAGVAGCTFWHNFSTYFNTIYLAQQHIDAYEEQQQAIVPPNSNAAVAVQGHRWLDEEYEMRQLAISNGDVQPIEPTFSQSLSATKQINNVHLDSAIILGSKVLADKKGTKYIEDALFIVGKAQFYKNDFAGARRKFLELLYKYPDTKYGAQVQVLLARSMLMNRQLDTAKAALGSAMAFGEKSGDKLVLSQIHRANAEYVYARNADSLTAIASELRQAEAGLSGEELARLAYQEGGVDYLNSDWPNAERAFQTVYESAKDDWLAGEGHIAHALALRREEKFDAATKELQQVVEKAKYGGSHPAARYELAYTQDIAARKAAGDNLKSDEFRTKYFPTLRLNYYVLDTSFKNSSAIIVARSKFRESDLYRQMGDYDSAARLAAGLIGTKDFSSPAMNEFVNQRASALGSFPRWRNEIVRVDSLEARIKQKPGAKFEEATVHVRAMQEALGTRWQPQRPVPMTREDSIKVIQIETRLRREQNAPKLTISDTVKFIDSLHYLAGAAHYQLGRAYEAFQEYPNAREEYQTALAYRFVIPDTVKTALRAQAIYAWMQLEMHQKNNVVSDSLLDLLLSHYGQTIYAEQARTLYAAAKRNSRGESAYKATYTVLRAQGIDAAKPSFLDIVLNYSKEDVAPRSLYAIGETYEEQEHYDSALTYYRKILQDYPYSSYAMALRPRLADASSALPHAPPANIDPTLQQNEEEQRQQAERLRLEREEELRRQAQQAMPGAPQIDSSNTEVHVPNEPPKQSPSELPPPPPGRRALPPGGIPQPPGGFPVTPGGPGAPPPPPGPKP
ncbi:MAG TPA: tetratricopeptide repeat protein [Candidatus Kapabacteria bacterium]|jgi:TolA-binding protein|nr:tetratricopeptide repeat protein [Candidatus Kapabacteria bacterium]